ncbi:MAG: amidohydrolase family protein [Elusimicrobiota bacterium]|nr:amidohydrolase family protein [Elusimicrobiota bacterium]
MTGAVALCALLWAAPARASDLILHNGKVFIAPGEYADAVAVSGARITAVGAGEELLARAGPRTRLIDLAGRAVTPGFHDAHVHFWDGAQLSSGAGAGNPLEEAVASARRLGVTSVSGILEGDRELEAWAELQRAGKATLRYWMWGRLDAPADFTASRERFSSRLPPEKFRWSGLKAWVDGDFDGWTAALFEPYSDKGESRGSMLRSPRDLLRLVRRGRELGYSVRLHAIGDRAVRAAVRACAGASERAPWTPSGGAPAPCVIEHADLVAEADRTRLASLGIVASMQPSRMIEAGGGERHPSRLGARRRGAFALKSMQAAGVALAFGSDWPDRTLNPLAGLSAAVARHGEGEEGPDESLTLEEAVSHYTAGAARAAGAGRELGVIRPGYRADLVVFDRDLFSLPSGEILKARVDVTIFDGEIVYERVDAGKF